MIISFLTLIIVSYLTKLLFTHGHIDTKYDFFNCFKDESVDGVDGGEFDDISKSQKSINTIDGTVQPSQYGTQETLVN